MKAVLTYHSIDASGSAISVSEAAFRGHVAWLGSGAVNVVPLEELDAVPESQDAVAITFDDGFASFGSIAAPLLLEAELPCTVFVVPGRVGIDNEWGGLAQDGIPTLPLLDWDELGALADSGVSLGAHTVSHPKLTALPRDEAEVEITQSVSEIADRTGQRAAAFAYPYGDHNDEVVGMAERHFDVAVTADFSLVTGATTPHRIPRLDMVYFRNPAHLAAWGSGTFRRYLRLRQVGRWVGQKVRR